MYHSRAAESCYRCLCFVLTMQRQGPGPTAVDTPLWFECSYLCDLGRLNDENTSIASDGASVLADRRK
jgi:hypothetical protein